MPGDETKPARGSGRRYSALVGLAFLALVVIATVNTIRTQSGGLLGISSGNRGMPLPEFAVPNAITGRPDRDANVFQDDCSTSQNPCPADATRPSACQIPREGAIRVCDLFDRPLVLSFWFTKGVPTPDCLPTQDALDRVASRYRGRVNFLSIDVRDDPSAVREIATERGWRIPVGYDRDGAVSDLYRVGGCPTLAFAYPGGILAFAKAGADNLSEGDITRDVGRLLRQSRTRVSESR
jgi:thiol-disulfide isomerase/thioredoxin